MPQTMPIDSEQRRDLTLRDISLRSESINDSDRSFGAVVATDKPVVVFDWRAYEPIDEILVAKGGDFPSQVPLLPNHQRYDVLDVIGSAREFKRDGGKWTGRGYVASPVGDNDPVKAIWNRIREGHITAVSVGYRVNSYVDIMAGKNTEIEGTLYEAGERTLRVTTSWTVHELSLTPIGADSEALIRSIMGRQPATKRRSYFR